MNLVDDDDVAADDDGGYLFLCDIPVFTDHDMELAMRLQQEEDAKTSSTTRYTFLTLYHNTECHKKTDEKRGENSTREGR